jgi:hypothetical protein
VMIVTKVRGDPGMEEIDHETLVGECKVEDQRTTRKKRSVLVVIQHLLVVRRLLIGQVCFRVSRKIVS